METGERQWYIIGCYLDPENALTIESVVAVLIELVRGAKLIMAGGVNSHIAHPEEAGRVEEITVDLASTGLEDMLGHFLP